METLELLKKFCTTDEAVGIAFLERPFAWELNGHRVAIATDGSWLCVAKNGCEGVEPLAADDYHPKIESLLLGNPDQQLSIDRLRAALAKTSMKHECPECGGLGEVGDDKAPMVYDTDYAITIGGQAFTPKMIKRLLDILHSAELLADWPFCVSTERRQMKIEMPDYIIVVAGCRCNEKDKRIEY